MVLRVFRYLGEASTAVRLLIWIQVLLFTGVLVFLLGSIAVVGERPDLIPGVALLGVAVIELTFVAAVYRAHTVEVLRGRIRTDILLRRADVPPPHGPIGGLLLRVQAILERLVFGRRR
jgi:hypothetical protein